jgi:CRISPR-associated protein Cst1
VLVKTLLEIERERRGAEEIAPCSVTAYWLTNYGTRADIDIFHLPLPIMRFLRTAATAKYHTAWDALVNRAWHDLGTKEVDEGIVTFRRNWFYEDLFDLPQEAPSFLRRYFLRQPIRKAKGVKRNDPRLTYSLKDEAALVSWELMTLFLREVMNMDRSRIEAIRQLGDRLANYVQTQDARLFNKVFLAQRYTQLRLELLRANTSVVKQGEPPLLTFDSFIEIFEEGEELARRDWSLARDLVLVRMIEQLHAAGWFKQHEEELEATVQGAAALG